MYVGITLVKLMEIRGAAPVGFSLARYASSLCSQYMGFFASVLDFNISELSATTQKGLNNKQKWNKIWNYTGES